VLVRFINGYDLFTWIQFSGNPINLKTLPGNFTARQVRWMWAARISVLQVLQIADQSQPVFKLRSVFNVGMPNKRIQVHCLQCAQPRLNFALACLKVFLTPEA
jgi:hypothetical protein